MALAQFVFQNVFSKREASEVDWHFVALAVASITISKEEVWGKNICLDTQRKFDIFS